VDPVRSTAFIFVRIIKFMKVDNVHDNKGFTLYFFALMIYPALARPLASSSGPRYRSSACRNCSVSQYEPFYWPRTTNSPDSANCPSSSRSPNLFGYCFFLAPTHVIVFLRGFENGPPEIFRLLENFCFQCPVDSGIVFHHDMRECRSRDRLSGRSALSRTRS
jgi:hypothetical protein